MSSHDESPGLAAVDFDPFADGALDLTIPATESQREVWAAVQMGDNASCAYNESMSLRIKGAIDSVAMRRALQAIVDRHESLRTTFSTDGATLCINRSQSLDVTEVDLSDLDASACESKLQEILQQDVATPFDLEHGPLFRAVIVKLESELFQVVMCAHHIICDGLSWAVLLPDLAALYADQNAPLNSADRYSDYAKYLLEEQQENRIAEAEAYWLKQYAETIPVLDMPTDRPRPKIKTYCGNRLDYLLDKASVTALKKVGAKNGCTFVVTLLSAFNSLLYRLTRQPEIVVGIMAAGNSVTGFNNLVGHCVNLLPVRCQISHDKSFVELLKSVRSHMFDATEYQQFSFGSLIKKLPIARDPSRIPLVPITFNIDQAERQFQIGGFAAEVYTNPRSYENFELFLNAAEYADNHVVLECTYNRDLFDETTIQRHMEEFEQLIQSISLAPEQAISTLALLPDDETMQLSSWNATKVPFPDDQLIHQLIEQQVASQADKIALVCGGEQITYANLDKRANQLAHHLRQEGVAADVLVGLALERSISMLVGQLAVLKAGGAYIPLDPNYPADRLSYMLEDAKAPLLLTQQSLSQRFDKTIKQVLVDTDSEAIAQQPTTTPELISTPDHLAYVIYTSGSTGRPKGVTVQHSCVVNFLSSMAKTPGITPQDVMLAVTTLSFDIAVLELLLPLSVGAQTVIATREEASDGQLLLNLMRQHHATIMQATPATWRMLLDADWPGSPQLKILCGGEALPLELSKILCGKVAELWNMYGPTETTIWSSCAQMDATDERVTIGRPIDNTEIIICDQAMQQQPIGVPGELLIGGAGVVRGYLNRPELTDERFVIYQGDRLYRTGDLARYLPDGRIECLGRLDDQVKVRGFRIELGEIESVLAEHSSVGQAVVAVKEPTPGDVRLVAYLILNPGEQIDNTDLRQQCQNRLPDYMIPQHFMAIEKLPLTPNGKIDRRALPDPSGKMEHGEQYVAPANETERRVAGIWQEVLKLERIGVHDNFFNLGGHSLLATRILSRLRGEFEMDIPLSTIFEYPTIQQMAERLSGENEPAHRGPPEIKPRGGQGSAPVSFSQQRLWFLYQLYPDLSIFNLTGAFRFHGTFSSKAFELSVNEIMRRHEILRGRFSEERGEPILSIIDAEKVDIENVDLQQLAPEVREKQLIQYIEKVADCPFNLENEPLLRLSLVTMDDQDHAMVIVAHPIVWDGWSFDTFLDELGKLYDAFASSKPSPLSQLPIQYADYPVWQRQWMLDGEMERQLAYWGPQLKGTLSGLALPTDRPRPTTPSYDGARDHIALPKELIDEITAFAHSEGATLYMVLLAVFNVLLYRYCNQDDIVFATQVQGRVRPETENLIGPFVNTLLLRTDLSGQPSFRQLLSRVRDVCLGTFSHQSLPFELLLDELTVSHDNRNAPPYQVMFTFQDTTNRSTKMADLDITQIDHNIQYVYTDMIFWLKETGRGLVGGLDYSTELFDAETIHLFLKHYKQLLKAVLERPNDAISSVLFSTPAEQQRLTDIHEERLQHQKKLLLRQAEQREIESQLVKHEAIAQCAVVIYEEHPGDKRMVAYLIYQGGQHATGSELRKYLQSHLPDRMVPSLYQEMDQLPLTSNGEIDRKSLPNPFADVDTHYHHVPPASKIEKQVATIWQSALKLQQVGTQDNFFDIGGHSLLSMQVVSQIEQVIGVRIPARAILMDTLAQIALYCENQLPDGEVKQEPSGTKKGLMGKLKGLLGS